MSVWRNGVCVQADAAPSHSWFNRFGKLLVRYETLLASHEYAQAQPQAGSANTPFRPMLASGFDPTPDDAVSSPPVPPTWATTLLVLAVIGAQIAQRRQRHPFTS